MGLPFILCNLPSALLANPLEPDLTITKQHTGNFSAGGIGSYTLTVTNIGSAPSSGLIAVTDTLPTGLTVNSGNVGLVAVSGANAANWTCNSNGATPQVITCQSNAVIDQTTGNNTSTLQFYVNLSTNISTGTNSITNTATVSGGGESITSNNSASDPTTVTPAPSFSCGTLYGIFGPNINSLRVYDPTTLSVGAELAAITGYSVTLGISPFLDSNGNRRLYYLNANVSPNALYYFDGVNHVNTGITVPNTPNRMGFSLDGILYMSAKVGSSQVFYRYDPSTNLLSGPITIINNPNNPLDIGNAGGSGDIAFDISGVMYLVTGNPTGSATDFRLYRIDNAATSTPVATLIDTAPTTSTTTSLGFTPDGQLYLISNGGRNWRWNLATGVTTELTQLGSANGGFDLASCFYPTLLPRITASKTVAKVAGAAGSSVVTGDTLEYSIIVRNSGSSIAAGTTLQDTIPTGTTYVANSTTLNSSPQPDIAGIMPFVTARPINGPGQVSGSLVVDTTPAITTDNEATIKFRVTVNANSPSKISNRATVIYAGAPNGGIPTDDPNTSGNDSTDLPIANRMPANVLFVKRITAINGASLNVYKDDTTSSHAADDNSPYWPTPLNSNAALGDTTISAFLRGAIDAGDVKPGDIVEYTVYILNAGNFAADSVKLCDRIIGSQQFTGTTIQLQQNSAAATSLTSAADADRATFYASSADPAITGCNFKTTPATDQGAVVVNVTGIPTWSTLAGSTGSGTANSYGFVRFITQINP